MICDNTHNYYYYYYTGLLKRVGFCALNYRRYFAWMRRFSICSSTLEGCKRGFTWMRMLASPTTVVGASLSDPSNKRKVRV